MFLMFVKWTFYNFALKVLTAITFKEDKRAWMESNSPKHRPRSFVVKSICRFYLDFFPDSLGKNQRRAWRTLPSRCISINEIALSRTMEWDYDCRLMLDASVPDVPDANHHRKCHQIVSLHNCRTCCIVVSALKL